MNGRCALGLTIVLVFASAVASAADVSFNVSARETYVGAPVTVEISVKGESDVAAPQFPTIAGADVRYLGPSSQSFTSISPSGTVRNVTTTHRYNVIPRKVGTLIIPAIEVVVDGVTYETAATSIRVLKSDADDLLFVKLVGERDTVYAGEPINVTLEIWIAPFRNRTISMSAKDMWQSIDKNNSEWGPFIENLQSRQPNVQYRNETIDVDGKSVEYVVYSLKRRTWAERPGKFDAGGVTIVVNYPVQVQKSRFTVFRRYEITRTRPVTATVGDSSITVLEPPTEGRPAGYRDAVGQFNFDVSAAPTEVSVGDPITLTLTVRGRGRFETLRAPTLSDQESLVENFRVPNEELPGVVEGNTKKFRQTIRAKHDAVNAIPPIEFSYFDPRRERYVTQRSRPIPITVKESSKLSVSQVVEGTTELSTRKTLTLTDRGLLANYEDVDGLLTSQTLTVGWQTWSLLGAGPGIFLMGIALRLRRDKLVGDSGFARRKAARGRALALMTGASGSSNGTVADQVAAVLTGYVADKCNLPAGATTRADAVRRLREQGLAEDVVARFDELLDECESARYGAVDATEGEDIARRARACLDDLERSKL